MGPTAAALADAPPTTGHRDRAAATLRRARAVELRLEGKTYDEIAEVLGVANRSVAYKLVSRALQSRESTAVQLFRGLELTRLDALQSAIWPRAMEGDVRAVNEARRIIQARAMLLGLYPSRSRKARVASGPTTVVMTAEELAAAGIVP